VQSSSTAGQPIDLREARRGDRDSFLEVILGSYGPFEHLLGLDTQGTDEMRTLFGPVVWAMIRLLRWVGRPPAWVLVAADGKQVVASTVLLPAENYGYIVAVATRPSHRRRGIAGHLVGRAEELARRGGRAWAVLDVEEENASAIALYRGRGYETIQTAVWLRYSNLGTVVTPVTPTAPVRVVGRSGRTAAAEWCRRRIDPRFAKIVTPTLRRLTHLERVVQLPGVARQVWVVGPDDAPLAFLSAYWKNSRSPGMLFLPAVDAGAGPEVLVPLILRGILWLREKGVPYVVAAVPDPASAAVPVLEGIGFQPGLTTLTMALVVDGAGTGPPKPS
jgi:ribosomal protein S18 acetylase RimI-like enzyme